MKLVLFDIDGTILYGGGAGRRAISRALIEVFGSAGPEDHRFDGKTDRQIVRELMRRVGHGDDHIDARMGALLERYLMYLDEELRDANHGARVCPGVRELLQALYRHQGAILGLLTGNLADGARAKLRAVNIDPDLFRVGAYGSDHEHRPQLPAIAQRRAREEFGLYVTGTDIVVIGDTPADIECGRDLGARAIAVATGHYSFEELAAHHPAAVFRDLSNTEAVLAAILQP